MIISVPYSVLPIYLAEISQPELRGAITSIHKVMWHFGLLYAYIAGAFTNYENMTYLMMIPCIIFTGAFMWSPESPYFLLMKNRRQDALKALVQLQGSAISDERISCAITEMEQAVKSDKKKSKGPWKDLISAKGSRKALWLSQFVAMIFIMTGTCVIELYETNSVTLITDNELEANLVTIILGAILSGVTIPAFFLADRLGRRPLLLTSCFGSGVALLVTAAVVLYFFEVQLVKWPSLLNASYATSIIALCFVTAGIEPVGAILQSELFNSNTRGVVAGITTINVGLFTVIVIKVYQFVQQEVGLYLVYVIFSFFSCVGYVVIYFFLPETKGKSLEEVQKMFL